MDISDEGQSCKKLLERIALYNLKADTKVDISIILQAIDFAKKYHAGQLRDSGEPFYTHPLEVAYMVCDWCFRTDILVTAILHDTIEDTEATLDIISNFFGNKVANNVMDLTRIKEDGTKITAAQLVELLFEQKKYDLLVVKQFDRIHNMRTLKSKSIEKISKTIKETIYTFIVLSAYLEMRSVEEEITRLCSQLIENDSTEAQKLSSSQSDAELLALILKNAS